jgi:hypothetical protein
VIRDPLDGSRGCLTPPSYGRTAKGRANKSESSHRSPRVGPGSGPQRTTALPGYALNADECRYVRMAPSRPAETPLILAETNTSRTDKRCEKNLAGAPTLLQGFGGHTRGCASTPPQNNIATRREECPISKLHPLWLPNGYHHRGSGATVGDNHEGPLMTGEKPHFSQNNKT